MIVMTTKRVYLKERVEPRVSEQDTRILYNRQNWNGGNEESLRRSDYMLYTMTERIAQQAMMAVDNHEHYVTRSVCVYVYIIPTRRKLDGGTNNLAPLTLLYN